ncbi:MAG TPA: flagellar export chaperone FliS [Firmicutes bacterium]|nr:flagellar export chaperone FliS [Bacillota bacterium]
MVSPYEHYKKVQVQTATPAELIIMAYDGAGVYLAKAREAMKAGDFDKAREAIKKVQAIVGELTASLDPAAGEIAVHLSRLYGFISERLGRASAAKDPRFLDEIARVLGVLREGWCGCARNAPKQ